MMPVQMTEARCEWCARTCRETHLWRLPHLTPNGSRFETVLVCPSCAFDACETWQDEMTALNSQAVLEAWNLWTQEKSVPFLKADDGRDLRTALRLVVMAGGV